MSVFVILEVFGDFLEVLMQISYTGSILQTEGDIKRMGPSSEI